MDVTHAATAFVLIVPVELPDKTFIATLVLATRYRALPVWLGVSVAFLVQSLVAVTAGGLLALLPRSLVLSVVAALFVVGAVILWRGARTADAEEREAEEAGQHSSRAIAVPWWRAAGASFGVLFVAEWGDLSQLLTAGLAARYDDPVAVFAGSWLALIVVAALAILLGRTLLRYLSLAIIRRIGAGVCAVLAVIALYDVTTQLVG